jgi:hypothetical protein
LHNFQNENLEILTKKYFPKTLDKPTPLCYNTGVSKEHTNQEKGKLTMENLINYINNNYALAVKYPRSATIYCDQSFGALQYHYTVNPQDFTACEAYWNEMRPKFYEVAMGVA